MNQSEEPEPMVDMQALAADVRWASRCLSVIAAATIGLLLYLLRTVLDPFVLAIFFTVGLRPILDFLQKRLLPSRLVAATATFLVGVVLMLLLGWAVASSIDQLANDDAYQQRATAATERFASLVDQFGLLPTDSADGGEEELSSVSRLRSVLRQGAESLREWLLGGMVTLSGSLGIVLIYMFFLLLGASKPSNESSELWNLIEGKLREYIVLKTIISLGTGIAVWIVLSMFGVPLALLMGLLTFLLNYIPNFGPLVTCLLPLPLIWLSPELSLTSMVLATILVCGVQLVSGNVIEPRMMGSSFDLHPIVVMLALMVWYAIWGFVGMLLAVPITASLKVIFERVHRTEPVARLLAGDLSSFRVGQTEEA